MGGEEETYNLQFRTGKAWAITGDAPRPLEPTGRGLSHRLFPRVVPVRDS